jgi:hypothetical protein
VKFPEPVRELQTLDVSSALLDGEVGVVLPSGLTSFQRLQNAFKGGGSREGLTTSLSTPSTPNLAGWESARKRGVLQQLLHPSIPCP